MLPSDRDFIARLDEATTFAELSLAVLGAIRSRVGPSAAHVCPLYAGACPTRDSLGMSERFSDSFMKERAFEAWPRCERELMPLEQMFASPEKVWNLNERFRTVEKTATYNEYWRMCHIEQHVMAFLGTGDTPLGFICVARSASERQFTGPEIANLEVIRTAAERALFRVAHANFVPISAVIAALRALEGSIAMPIGLFDSEPKPIWLNGLAMGECTDGLYAAGQTLIAPKASVRLHKWMDAMNTIALAGNRGRRQLGNISVQSIFPAEGPLLYLVAESSDKAARKRWSSLTSREKELAMLAAKGYAVANIAAICTLSPGTVRNHLKSVYKKLGVRSRVELTLRLLAGENEGAGPGVV